MAQAWPKAKPKLTQEAFDEAVSSNIEDFDMPREEAVKSALDEFKLQGYDVNGVVTSMTTESLDSHPVALASQRLRQACEGEGEGSLPEALEQLSASLTAAEAAGSGQAQEACVIAHKNGAMQTVLAACKQLAGQADALLPPLALLRKLLAWLETRDAFSDAKGPEVLLELLSAPTSSGAVQAAVAAAAEAGARGVEETKCRLVDVGFAAALLGILAQPSTSLELVAPACGVIRSVTTADDERPPSSKAFMHARMLAKASSAIKVLLGVLLRVPPAEEPALLVVVLGTVRQVAANEEICREFSDDGGVRTCLAVLRQCSASRDVVRACLSALRQLAHSDGVKKLVAASGGIEGVLQALSEHTANDDVVEAGLGLLGNMMLRQPEICTQAADAGVIDTVIEAMQVHAAKATVQRQACLLIRIMVARNTELRPPYLEKGAEALLRQAKAAHPGPCKDVGSAALRDLGLDNYND